jgi:hypothetical protein
LHTSAFDRREALEAHHTALREHFNPNFYTCSTEMLAGLSEMWVSDARFSATFDKIKPGLAQFWHDAVQIYCTNRAKR